MIFLVFSFQTLKELKKLNAERRKLEENAVIVTGYHLVCDGNSSPKKITEHSAPFKNIQFPDYAIRRYSEPPMMGVFNETRVYFGVVILVLIILQKGVLSWGI